MNSTHVPLVELGKSPWFEQNWSPLPFSPFTFHSLSIFPQHTSIHSFQPPVSDLWRPVNVFGFLLWAIFPCSDFTHQLPKETGRHLAHGLWPRWCAGQETHSPCSYPELSFWDLCALSNRARSRRPWVRKGLLYVDWGRALGKVSVLV